MLIPLFQLGLSYRGFSYVVMGSHKKALLGESRVAGLGNEIIPEQKQKPRYDYMSNEQKESDKPRFCSSHLLRAEKPCCNARFTILILNILVNMLPGQNRSNFAFRLGFSTLATITTAKSGLKQRYKTPHGF